MEDTLAPFGASSCCLCPCQQWLAFMVTVIREELSRTPMIGRLCPSRDSAVVTTWQPPFLKLPETLLAWVFGLGGLSTTFNIALTSRQAYALLWRSPFFWRTLLQALGISEQALKLAGLEGCVARGVASWPDEWHECEALRIFARHWLLGIGVLTGWPKVLGSPKQSRGEDHTLSLEDAKKAVLALKEEDGKTLIQKATESIVRLLRTRGSGEKELLHAEALLEAVGVRSDIFNTAQMLSMLGAHQHADEENDLLSMAVKNSNTLRTSQVTRRRPAVQDIMPGQEVSVFPVRPSLMGPFPSTAA